MFDHDTDELWRGRALMDTLPADAPAIGAGLTDSSIVATDDHARYQAVVGELAWRALMGTDLDMLFQETVTTVAAALTVECCHLLELLPSAEEMLLRAGVGWGTRRVRIAKVPARDDSQAAFTLRARLPVISNQLRTEQRFRGGPLVDECRPTAGVSVEIHSGRRTYGVLIAHTARPRSFGPDDAHFLQSVAYVLAQAIERKQAEFKLADSRRFLESTLNALPSQIAILDASGTIVAVNDAWRRFAGAAGCKGQNAGVGRDYFHVCAETRLHGEQAEGIARGVGEVIHRQRDDYRAEYAVLEGHRTRWTRLQATRFGSDGSTHVVVSHEDITAERLAEHERTSFFEQSVNLLCVAGMDGHFRRINPAWTATLGFAAEDLLAMPYLEIVHPDDRVAMTAEVQRLAAGAATISFECRCLTRDGDYRCILWSATPLVDRSGFYATGHDITQRKHAEEALAERVTMASLAADIGVTLAHQNELAPMLQECAEAMVRHLGAAFARIWTVDEVADVLELAASAGMYRHTDGAHARIRVGQLKIGRIAQDRQPHVTNDVQSDPQVSNHQWAAREGMRAFAGYPLICGQRLLGVVGLFSRKQLSETVTKELAAVADGIAMGMERARVAGALRESEGRFDLAIRGSSDGVWDWNILTDDVFFSPRYKEMLGYEDHELANHISTWESRLHPQDRHRVLTAVRRHLKQRLPFEVEFRMQTKTGEFRWYYARGQAVWDASGEAHRMAGSLSDITARKHAERELFNAHAETEQLLASISSILVGTDDQECITKWNAAAEETFGIPASSVIGRPFLDCGIQWQSQDLADSIAMARQLQRTLRIDDLRFTTADSGDRVLSLSIDAIHDEGGEYGGLLLLGEDITEQRNLETQLRQAQKLESIGQLAAGIAHEINTPIQYISDNARFLKESFASIDSLLSEYNDVLSLAGQSRLTSERIARAESAREAADVEYLATEIPSAIDQSLDGLARVAAIVRAMKDFSYIGGEEKTEVDINRSIESTILVARNEWKYVAEVVTDFDTELPLVSCQPGEINQVVLNLIVNAAHAIADNPRRAPDELGRIIVTTRKIDEWVEIRVRDSGTGIPDEIRSRIFDPFFTTKEVGRGTGQGLAIAYSVVAEKHGGTINFETEVGHGTTFIVRLPLAPTAAVSTAGPRHFTEAESPEQPLSDIDELPEQP
ncbi:MAG: PAS domain S-box protein [Planctomycetia bacterium]|nr:PAS domain S-box protein [Planctomycetia bacterium]